MRDAQETEGLALWCHSCKASFFIAWSELDRLRAERRSTRVLCRCKRWIGNIGVNAHVVDDCKR